MPKKLGSTEVTNNCICLLSQGEVPKFVEPTVANLKLHLPGLYAEIERSFRSSTISMLERAFKLGTAVSKPILSNRETFGATAAELEKVPES